MVRRRWTVPGLWPAGSTATDCRSPLRSSRGRVVTISLTCRMCGHARTTLGRWDPKDLRNLPRISPMLGMSDIAQSAYLPISHQYRRKRTRRVPPSGRKGTSRMGAFRTLNRGTEFLLDLT